MAKFYGEVLGFRVSDWIGDFFVFMRCNADHHAVNFIAGKNVKMHHIAFELRDFSHLQTACDLFGDRKIPIIWGPVRLGPGHNVAAFHRDHDDWVVEFYCRARSDEGRGARLFRSAALAPRPPAAAEGVGCEAGGLHVGAAADAGLHAQPGLIALSVRASPPREAMARALKRGRAANHGARSLPTRPLGMRRVKPAHRRRRMPRHRRREPAAVQLLLQKPHQPRREEAGEAFRLVDRIAAPVVRRALQDRRAHEEACLLQRQRERVGVGACGRPDRPRCRRSRCTAILLLAVTAWLIGEASK